MRLLQDNMSRTTPASATLIALALVLTLPAAAAADDSPQPWPAAKAWEWYESQPWLVGFNYIPATAINTTEMWQADTFDPATIDAELAMAQRVGFNCARVFVQYVAWEADPAGVRERIDRFLAIAKRRGIRTMLVLFDDCNFTRYPDPFPGKQPAVVPGEYANGWMPSPGPRRVQDRGAWPKLQQYVKDLVGAFARDKRVLAWETYNEPSRSPALVEAAMRWAREAGPTQPVTTTVWGDATLQARIMELSDVVSFHEYGPAAALESHIQLLLARGRPVLCTEWLNRPGGSVPAACLPVLAKYRVGCFHWGLVNGKTQTHFPWGSKAGAAPPKVWQHDIFRSDRTPYDAKEIAAFTDIIRQGPPREPAVEGRWSIVRAWQWYDKQPWPVGCNFVPSTAVNDVEMWQAESFDPATIDRELGMARGLGFNTVRVFVNYVVWKADAEGLKRRLGQFFDIAERHRIRTLVILLDDCFKQIPRVGKQDEPVPGVHNSQWVASPGEKMVKDAKSWGELERYVKDVVRTFGRDRRVLAWDLYNEPTQSLALVEAAFRWARQVGPEQPLTTCVFGGPAECRRIAEWSDVVSFHNYGPLADMNGAVAQLAVHRRPLLCTEWMCRPASRFESHLPYLKGHRIGAWNWGLVAGRTQTYFPWGSPQGAPEPAVWFHDILRKDGTPMSPREARFVRVTTGVLPPSALPAMKVLVPTAEARPVAWRFTLEKPADNWMQPGFDDAAWKQGAAPFGREEPPFARKPNTAWTGTAIWLRREFAMPPGKWTDLALRIHYDENAEVYIDGVLAWKSPAYTGAYETVDILPEAAKLLARGGKHTMAAVCRQTGGGQYFDVGIVGADDLTRRRGNAEAGQ